MLSKRFGHKTDKCNQSFKLIRNKENSEQMLKKHEKKRTKNIK